MQLSELLAQLKAAPIEALDCLVSIAEPDTVPGDGIDVFIIGISDVLVDHDHHRIVFIPRSASGEDDTDGSIPLLSLLMDRLPFDAQIHGDFDLFAEAPLNRELDAAKTLIPIEALHIGMTDEEAWLLVRPASAYLNGVLPA